MIADGTSFALVNGAACRFDLRRRGEDTLILIHELGGSLNSWDALLPLFDGRLTILRCDLRGAGMSQKLRGINDLDVLADDIAALADLCALSGAATIVGAAMGAAVAVRFATRHPKRARSLVLLGPALGVPAERREAARQVVEAIEAGGMDAIADAILPRAFPEDLWDNAATKDLALARWYGADPEGYAASYRVLIEHDLRPELVEVDCPVLVLAGAYDPFGPPESLEAGTARLPRRTFRTIEAGHFMAVQSPALVAQAMRGWQEGV